VLCKGCASALQRLHAAQGVLHTEAQGVLHTEAQGVLHTEAQGVLLTEAQGALHTEAHAACRTCRAWTVSFFTWSVPVPCSQALSVSLL